MIKRIHEQKLKENGLGYIDPKQNRVITTHGFHSTFRDWSADKTDYPSEVCEHFLALPPLMRLRLRIFRWSLLTLNYEKAK